MLSKEMLQKRVDQLKSQVETSANNHNALVGRLAEAMYALKFVEDQEAAELKRIEEEFKKAQDELEKAQVELEKEFKELNGDQEQENSSQTI